MSNNERCAFCQRLEAIYAQALPTEEQNAAMDALWDLADRAQHARQVYKRRRGYLR